MPAPLPDGRLTVDEARLDRLLEQVSRYPVKGEVIPPLRERIAEGSDDQAVEMRAFGVADVWGENRLEVLRLFLYASRAGVLELCWELMCPNCRVPKDEVNDLGGRPASYHCDTCGISYDADFDERVELRFSVHPAVRVADDAVYCIAGPARSPHVLAQQYLRPGEARSIAVAPSGPLRLRTVPPTHELNVLPASAGVGAGAMSVTYAADRWVAPDGVGEGETLALPTGTSLELCNETNGPVLAVLEDTAEATDITTAAQVTAMQEFRDLFVLGDARPGAAARGTEHRPDVQRHQGVHASV